MLPIYKGSKSDEWETPQELITRIKLFYPISFDLAATKENAKAKQCFTKADNSLKQNWDEIQGISWLNPPFSKANQFFQKAAQSKNQIIAIYKASNLETDTWQRWILPHAKIHFINKRVNYLDKNKPMRNGVPFGSALIFFRIDPNPKHLPKGIMVKQC